jgi:hypothetical protein
MIVSMSNDLERQIRKAVNKTVERGMKEVGDSLVRDLNNLGMTNRGKSTAKFDPLVRQVLTKHGLKFDASDVTAYAQALSEGRKIEAVVKAPRL